MIPVLQFSKATLNRNRPSEASHIRYPSTPRATIGLAFAKPQAPSEPGTQELSHRKWGIPSVPPIIPRSTRRDVLRECAWTLVHFQLVPNCLVHGTYDARPMQILGRMLDNTHTAPYAGCRCLQNPILLQHHLRVDWYLMHPSLSWRVPR